MSVAIDKFIVSTPGTVGGRPRIAGSRIAVQHIAVWWQMGYNAEQIINRKYSHLTLAEVYAALAYYHANKEEIDAAIIEEEALYERLAEEARLANNELGTTV